MSLIEHELKNAYIGEYRAPGENTLAYFPLADDLLDHSGNHTMTKTDTTYGTIAKDSTGFYHFTGGYLASESYTGPTQGTISVWVKRENKSTGETTLQRGFGIQYTGSSPFYNMAFEFNKSYYITTGTGTAHFINVGASTLNTWELWTATFSSATGGKMYKNGVLVDSFSDSNNLWSATGYSFVGGNAYGGVNTGLQYFKGYLSDAIIENVARTAEDVSNYYNLTKSKYGL